MRQLEDLVRFENASSALAFRERVYHGDERAELVRDLLALANAAVTGPRFLFLGVGDTVGGERRFVGVTPEDWNGLKSRLGGMLGGMIEPPPKVVLRTLPLDGLLVGMLCLPSCNDPPYLVSAAGDSTLPAGCGWVRRGTKTLPLLRADLQRLFAAKLASAAPAFAVEIGFAGDTPQAELALPVLELDALPSAVAARKIRTILETRINTKAALGRTETHMSRLVHARLFGVDQPYESHSEESLRMQIARAAEDHRAADEHYAFEVRAHKLELVVRNPGSAALSSAVLHLKVPRVEAMGVAERLVGATSGDHYPLVKLGKHSIDIEAEIGTLAAGSTTRVFREAPRLWARRGAAGRTLPLSVTLHARELHEPLHETLFLRFVAA